MNARVRLAIGVVFALIAICGAMFLWKADRDAHALDTKQHIPAVSILPAGACGGVLSQVVVEKRSMSDNESQVVTAILRNSSSKECKATIDLQAPDFTVAPATPITRDIAGLGTTSVKWILSARRPGTFKIAVSQFLDTQIVGVSVTDAFGFGPRTIRSFAIITAVVPIIVALTEIAKNIGALGKRPADVQR